MRPSSGLPKNITEVFKLRRPLQLVWRNAPGWTLLNVLIVLLQGVLPLVSLYFLKQIVDSAVIAGTVVPKDDAIRQVIFWVILAAAAALLSILCHSLSTYVGEAQAQVVTDAVTESLHRQSTTIDLEYYDNPEYFNILHRALHQAPSRPLSIVNNLIQVGQNGISSAGIIVLLVAVSWLIAPLLFLATIPELLVRLAFARARYRYDATESETERKAWYYHWLMTDADNAKEVRLFHLGEVFRLRYAGLRARLRQGRLALSRRRTFADFTAQACAMLAVFTALAYTAYLAVHGAISLGTLVMNYQGFIMGIGYFQGILRGLAKLYEDNLYLDQYYAFLALKAKIAAPDHPAAVPPLSQGGITFHNVAFSYPGQQTQVLKDVSLTIPPGQVVALVGTNGAGKTTLVNLLCRLYEPTHGAITVDGIDLRETDPDEWRKQISVIFQNYVQYHFSALDNIWVGDCETPPTREQVLPAALISGADPIIQRLPQGYDTVLGRMFEDGAELSVGQWQKIALARAFFRNAQLIVLDEPTSALDPLAEADVFRQFRRLVENRSAVLISHRFSTVQMADYIYVLDDGRIIEHGAHDTLLARNGYYASLYRAQAEYYQIPAADPLG